LSKKTAPVSRSWRQKIWRGLKLSLLGFFALSIALVLLLRWVNPPITAIKIIRAFEPSNTATGSGVKSCWLSLSEFGPNLPMAVIASEDQRFSTHHGFDFTELSKAMQSKGRKRGASTLSQQVAKNLFLWQGRSFVRKGLEAYFTTLIELFWSKRRILEMYLNIVEFGDATYGGCAGAKRSFNTLPARLSPYQAALMAASLPNPHRMLAAKPSPQMHKRASWAVKQMRALGGAQYLATL
jgi:monofunctional glycosyltransferase